jgi:hypothetical protein
MLRLHVDYNERELLQEGIETIVVYMEENKDVSSNAMQVGEHILLSDGITECQAILRHGVNYEWVADIIEGTTIDLK